MKLGWSLIDQTLSGIYGLLIFERWLLLAARLPSKGKATAMIPNAVWSQHSYKKKPKKFWASYFLIWWKKRWFKSLTTGPCGPGKYNTPVAPLLLHFVCLVCQGTFPQQRGTNQNVAVACNSAATASCNLYVIYNHKLKQSVVYCLSVLYSCSNGCLLMDAIVHVINVTSEFNVLSRTENWENLHEQCKLRQNGQLEVANRYFIPI